MIKKIEAASLLAGLDLGSAVAELDTLLETARVETSVFDDLLADRIDLIPGTKGSGKTALYRIFVDFLPKTMLKDKKVVIAHGVKQRQDTVFLAYKKQFDQLTESDFVDFWCIYLMSLAYEQFIRADDFAGVLAKCSDEISVFRAALSESRPSGFWCSQVAQRDSCLGLVGPEAFETKGHVDTLRKHGPIRIVLCK